MNYLYILTRYYAPHPSIDTWSVCRMEQSLARILDDIRIVICHVDVPYIVSKDSCVAPSGDVEKIKPLLNSRQKTLRFLSNAVDGFRLVRKASRNAAAVICMTNPPFITYWAGRMFKQKGIPWANWTFDLYPYLLTAAGITNDNNTVYRYLRRSIENRPPDLLISLGEHQARFMQAGYCRDVPHVILPCGTHDDEKKKIRPVWKEDDTKVYFAYVGNLGEAHSADFLIDFIECLNPARHVCILAVYGSKADQVLKSVGKKPMVRVLKWIDKADLHFVDVHLVSLLPQWTHMCVPSKAISAVCSEGAIIFNGLASADTWQQLKDAGWLVNEGEGGRTRKEKIEEILKKASEPAELLLKKKNAFNLKEEVLFQEKEAYRAIAGWVQRVTER